MATAAAAAAAAATRTFRIGRKKVFLPNHVITFLRPKDYQPPQFATFKVPLTFNKLDLRDYLFHAYNVPVLGVRSQLRAQRIRRSRFHKRIYRPPPIKTMTVELTKPFVWPARPVDKSPWNSVHTERNAQVQSRQRFWERTIQKTGKMPLRKDRPIPSARAALRDEARRLLREGGWENGRALDPKFEKRK
ncbi:hypothetical protein F5X99DRAFT_406597 [Biscogniauxia marginata]|nr:hypothetical protein F5X99DRAFT_406597 [Biscogniauxia marginata]